MNEPILIRLTVRRFGRPLQHLLFSGPRPVWPFRLPYRRGTTTRHSIKTAKVEEAAAHKPYQFVAHCPPHKRQEWLTLILPQNGFTPVLNTEQAPAP